MPISRGSKCPFCHPRRTLLAPRYEKGSSTNVGKLILAKKSHHGWLYIDDVIFVAQSDFSPLKIVRWLRLWLVGPSTVTNCNWLPSSYYKDKLRNHSCMDWTPLMVPNCWFVVLVCMQATRLCSKITVFQWS